MTSRYAKKLPALWLMTDERVETAILLAAAARLPKGGAGIIFRHYRTDAAGRRALFEALRAIARRRRLLVILAGRAGQAAAWKADGWHGRDPRPATRPLVHSMPAHDAREVKAAGGADVLFLSPLFPTRSHPGERALGPGRFSALARRAKQPVMALGGVRAMHRRRLRRIGASGFAAIDGLTVQP